ncbi:MAG: hypothetical protein KDB51_14910 [Propionibacteriaceae bacterium]|nr:hypothetical protein [Propionibacteriaceae bacterium]
MTTRPPVNRCRERSCPVLGHWPEGEACPLHADDPTPRRPTPAEADDYPGTGHYWKEA